MSPLDLYGIIHNRLTPRRSLVVMALWTSLPSGFAIWKNLFISEDFEASRHTPGDLWELLHWEDMPTTLHRRWKWKPLHLDWIHHNLH